MSDLGERPVSWGLRRIPSAELSRGLGVGDLASRAVQVPNVLPGERGPVVAAFLHVHVNRGRGRQGRFSRILRSNKQRKPRSSLGGKDRNRAARTTAKGAINEVIMQYRGFNSNTSHRGFSTININLKPRLQDQEHISFFQNHKFHISS